MWRVFPNTRLITMSWRNQVSPFSRGRLPAWNAEEVLSFNNPSAAQHSQREAHMKKTNTPIIHPSLRCLAVILASVLLTSYLALAVPYASQVVRTGNNVSFVLNHEAQGITVLRDGNPLTPPLSTTAGSKSFDMTGYTSFQIIVTGNTAKAWTQVVPDGAERNFFLPRGLAVNKNPASPNFGKVYVSESRGGLTAAGRTTADGIYILRADGIAEGGVKTGGIDWTTDGTAASAPLRSTIGPDDHLYVVSLFDDLAWEFNDDLSVATQILTAENRTGAQWVHGIYVEGTKAAGDRKVYLMNGNYNDTARKGLIMYDFFGNDTATAFDTGTQIIGPSYFVYYGYDIARDSQGFWYLNNYRANVNQAAPIAKFDGSIVPNNTPVWEASRTYYYAENIDIYERGRLAAYGHYNSGGVLFFNLDTGAYLSTLSMGAGTSRVRELAFDIAGNLVTVDSGKEYARFWSPGGNTIATTRSDGTFDLFVPDNLTVVATEDSVASEEGPDPAVFTISRFGGANEDLLVHFTLSGTATAGADYTTSVTSPFVFKAGHTSTNITITPVNDSQREGTETVVLALTDNSNYYIATPGTATITILDNDMSVRYWDANGTEYGAGYSPVGTWGVDNFWNAMEDGTGTPGPWTDWVGAVFSAGADASWYNVTVSGTQKADFLSFEEGFATLDGGKIILTNFSGIKVAENLTATINSVLGGPGLILDGPGTLAINGANDYNGPTIINGGTLQLYSEERIPNNSAVRIGSSGKLDLYAYSETVGSLASSTGAVANIPGGLTLTFGGDNTDAVWNGTTTGGGMLAKVGTGTISIGAGTIAEPLSISNGVVAIDAATDLGSSSPADIFIDGGTLRGSDAAGGTLFVPYGRSIIFGPKGGVVEAAAPADICIFGNVNSAGTLQGGTMIKDGPGELRVSGKPQQDSTYQKLVIRGGLYRGGFVSPIQDERFLGAIPDTFMPDQITIRNGAVLGHSLNPFEISPNRGIVLGEGGGRIRDSIAIPGVISGTTLIKDLPGSLVLLGANTYSGGTLVSSGSLLVRNASGSGTGSGTVNVSSGNLGGDGIIGGPVVMTGGNLTPGYSYTVGYAALTPVSNSIAKLVLNNGLDMSGGGTNIWQLAALSTANPGVEFDQVEIKGGNLVLGGNSRLVVSLVGTATAPTETDPFWQQTRQWKIVSLTGTAANPGNSN
jgi:autotransporter-associated beta strand protein